MSQTKQKTKIKTSTVAIIALSMILVLSLVATITLAYFSATRNVVTTVRFANGVSLQMWGAQFKSDPIGSAPGTNPDTPPSNSVAVMYWVAKTGTGGTMNNMGSTYGGYEGVNATLEFENLRVRAVDADAYVAFKLVITATDKTGANITPRIWDTTTYNGTNNNPYAFVSRGFVAPTTTTNWKVYNSTTQGTGTAAGANWYVYTGNNATIQKLDSNDVTATSASASDPETDFELIFGNYDNDGANPGTSTNGYKIPQDPQYMNDFAGVTFTFTLFIVASDTQDGLNDMINGTGTNGSYTVGTAGASQMTVNPATCNQYGVSAPVTP